MMKNFNNQFQDGLFLRLRWAQDEASAVCCVYDRLQDLPIEWRPRSPNLMPCNYFLWGYLKNKVYRTPLQDTSGSKCTGSKC